ncbi:MAG: DNA methyltransferase [Candidatus Korobacteraceae bacterium]
MTEVIWEGKYIEGRRQSPVRVALPFQTIETVNESALDRTRNLELFSSGRPTEWRNRLIWGDKKYVLPSLLPEFAGKVNLIYIDPPFDTGADFSYTATLPRSNGEDGDEEPVTFGKEPSILEQKAYRDTWGRGLNSYLHWFYEAAVLLHELLASDGTMYVHIGSNVSHYAKAILDEVFGPERYVNEIIWKRQTAHSDVTQGAKHLGRLHDTLLLYTKSESFNWQMQYTPYSDEYFQAFYKHVDPTTGRRYRLSDATAPGKAFKGNPYYEFLGVKRYWRFSKQRMEELYKQGRIVQTRPGTVPAQKRYADEMPGVPLQDLWLDIKPIQAQSGERVGYDTQKPETLLERVLKLSSKEDDLVLDCFVGSGTTAVVAEKLGRRWIACDLGRFSIHTSRKRLLSVSGVKPFAVQNLGKYERQAWQTAEFRTGSDGVAEQQRLREAAYRKFILDLYRATPLNGHTWLHGLKAGRMVHIGAVDAPVTLTDIKAIAREVWKAAGGGGANRKAAADILGWEFAFELNETARQVAAESRVDVAFKKIPREVLEKKAVEQGDIKFFELGALSVEPKQKGRELWLKLTDFVIPIDDVPEVVRKAIKHWSQMVDYWAVDWNFRDDTFHNEWQSYRARQKPDIELSVRHDYEQPGRYRVVVKVIDILGNDTTKTLDIQVK